MNKKRHIELLLKQEKGNIQASEQAKLDQLHQEEDALADAKIFQWSKQYSGGFEPNVDAAWSKFQTKMENTSSEAIVKPLFSNLLRIVAAVAVLVVAVFAMVSWRCCDAPARAWAAGDRRRWPPATRHPCCDRSWFSSPT